MKFQSGCEWQGWSYRREKVCRTEISRPDNAVMMEETRHAPVTHRKMLTSESRKTGEEPSEER